MSLSTKFAMTANGLSGDMPKRKRIAKSYHTTSCMNLCVRAGQRPMKSERRRVVQSFRNASCKRRERERERERENFADGWNLASRESAWS